MKQNLQLFLAASLLTVFTMSAATPSAGAPNGGWALPKAKMPEKRMYNHALEDQFPAQTIPGRSLMPTATLAYLPARIAENKSMLMGFQQTDLRGYDAGMYKLRLDGTSDFAYTTDYSKAGYDLIAAWIRDGKMCSMYELAFLQIDDCAYVESDIFTGEIIKEQQISLKNAQGGINYLPLYLGCAYDPTDNTLWGYTISSSGDGYSFFTADADDVQNTVAVVEQEEWGHVCASMCYNPKDGLMYGINRNNDFVTIDREGNQSVIMPLGVNTIYQRTGLVYDEADDCYLWNGQTHDYESALFSIDPKHNSLSVLTDYEGRLSLPFIGIFDMANDPAPINRPIIDEVDFGKGLNSGTISVFMPSTMFSGAPISGMLNWKAYIDDTEYCSGTAEAGSRVTVEFEEITNGTHTFSFDVSQEEKASGIDKKTMFIGYDTPRVPTNVTLDNTSISWTPVTRGLNGGYMDMEELTYHVFINDVEVGVTKETTFQHEDYSNLPYAGYRASVIADNSGFLSEMSDNSDIITIGKPWELPVHITPTNTDLMAFSAFDLNGDQNTWSYVNLRGTTPTIKDPLSQSAGNDDWLFSPPLALNDIASVYQFSFDLANVTYAYKNLSMQVYLCKDLNPNSVITKLFDETPADKEFHHLSQVFTIPEPGTYYIAFYTKGEPYQHGLYLNNIDLVKTDESLFLPAAVTDLKAVGADLGALNAEIDFSIPTKYLTGEVLSASTEVEIEIATPAETITVKGKPGEKMHTSVKAVQGNNAITVIPMLEGEKGETSRINVYCGVDVPGPATNVSAYVSDDNRSLILSWAPPTATGENGYYVDTENVEYVIMRNTSEAGWIEYDRVDSNTFEYTYTREDDEMKSEWIGIAPANVAGRATTYAWMSDMLGKPYPLPIDETFDGGQLNYGPIRKINSWDESRVTQWVLENPSTVISSTECERALIGYTQQAPATGCLMLPKFNTVGVEDAGISFDMWTGNNMADITILGERYKSESLTELCKVLRTDGWTTVEFRLPDDFQNQEWISIFILANYAKTNEYAMISGYRLHGGFPKNSIDGIADSNIRIAGGDAITIDGCEGQTIRIFATDGRLIKVIGKAAAHEKIDMAPGLYIVKTAAESVKVLTH